MGSVTQQQDAPAPVEAPTLDELEELVPPGYEPAVPLAPAEDPGLNA